MAKSTIQNFKNTIQNRITSVTTDVELFELTNELREWIDWLRKNNKISKEEYLHLNNLIMEEKRNIQAKSSKVTVTKNSAPPRRVFFPVVIIFLAIILLLGSLYYLYFPTVQEEIITNAGTIPFRGTLKNAESVPIDTRTDVVFRLYGDQNSAVPLYEGKCIGTEGIIPDYRGEFTVILGSDCSMSPIPEEVLKNDVLYLGVAIASGDEITPRYRILSSTYSHNSAQIAGKSLGTGKDTIPYIDSEAVMLIEAADPSIKSTSGTFLIEGASLSLKAVSGGGGSIMMQPDAGGYTLVPSGNVGIGVFEPTSKLEVVGLEPYNPITNVKNISIEDSESTNVLSLGLGTSSKGENARFISFRADVSKEENGSEVGSIRLNNEGVSYETKGADFAEYFNMDVPFKYQSGTIISLSNKGIRAAEGGEVIIGVISNTAGFVGNAKNDTLNSQLIGLVGQVDTLVTNENGLVSQGDRIGVGTVPGYGVISTNSHIVGYALGNVDSTRMQTDLCPKEYRNIRDRSGDIIKCGRVKILLRPN